MSVRVPTRAKKVLTTLQITQFIVGASFAFSHLVIAYQIPVSVPYTFSLGDAASIASAVTTSTASAVSAESATGSAGVASWMKKLAFRAAGREGLAENVENEQGERIGVDVVYATDDLKGREIRYRNDLHWIHCIDTSGQAFAILLNCLYLAPLTFLFVKFFIRAYSRRLERRRSSVAYKIEQSAKDAFHGVARQAMEAIGGMHGAGDEQIDSTAEAVESSETAIEEQTDSARKSVSNGLKSNEQATEHEIESAETEAQGGMEPVKQASEQAADSVWQLVEEANEAQHSIEEGANAAPQSVEGDADATQQSVDEDAEASQQSVEEDADATQQLVEGGADATQQPVEEVARQGLVAYFGREAEFQKITDYLLQKNAELYRRLAQ